MDFVIKVFLENITRNVLPLHKSDADTKGVCKDSESFDNFECFVKALNCVEKHIASDMTSCASLLFEMQNSGNVPQEYMKFSEKFSGILDMGKNSTDADYIYFAYDAVRELSKNESLVETIVDADINDVYSVASYEDECAVIAVVNNSAQEHFVTLEISGLPGRKVKIDYYVTDALRKKEAVCKTDTSFTETKVVIPLPEYSLHLFKIK